GAACNVSPGSINPNGGTATAQVSITTTARGAALLPPGNYRLRFAFLVATLTAGMLVLCFSKKRLYRLRWMAAPVLASALLVIAACSGDSGVQSGPTPTPNPTPSPTPSGGGTPAGTYSLTITGTSGNTTHNTTMTLVVN
ncbi:MAG TPA: hypothetical protein VJV96_15935, partial [Candidatus Angelobacter sp.]|nr:hypothetical protein [Candidatus Angelobacter sp.]